MTDSLPHFGAGPISGDVTEDSGTPNVISAGNITTGDQILAFTDLGNGAGPTYTGGDFHNLNVTSAPGTLGTLTAVIIDDATGPADVNGQIRWSYSVSNTNAAIQALGAGETLTQTFTLQILDSEAQTVNQTITIIIHGTNDYPTLSADVSGPHTLTETQSTQLSTATLSFTDIDITDTQLASKTLAAGDVTWSGGTVSGAKLAELLGALNLTVSGETPLNASGTLTATLTATAGLVDFLAFGETLTLNYHVTIDDQHGGTSTQTVTYTITGTNDAPVFSVGGGNSAAAALTETNAALSASGTLTVTDVDLTDYVSRNVLSVSTDGPTGGLSNPTLLTYFYSDSETDLTPTGSDHGLLNWSFNSTPQTFDYLAAGESLALTYTIGITDGHGGTATQNVVITINGSNDAPTVSVTGTYTASDTEVLSGTQTVSASGSFEVTDLDLTNALEVTEGTTTLVWSAPGTIPSAVVSALTAGGAFTVSDTDGSLTNNHATVGWSFSANTDFNFLAQGETLTISTPVTVIDNAGATVTRTIVFTVTGANDAPVVTIGAGSAAAPLTEADAGLSATGSLTVTDVDLSDTVTVTNKTLALSGVTGPLSGVTALGFLTTTPAGDLTPSGQNNGPLNWSFNSGAEAFNFLAAGETLNLTYTLTVSDNHSGSTTQNVTITVTGTNDLPTLTPTNVAGTITEAASGSQATLVTGSFTASDLDLSNSVTETHGAATVVWSGGSLATLNPTLATDLGATGSLMLNDTNPATNIAAFGWTYNAGSQDFNFLGASESITITYDVLVHDTLTTSVTQSVTITINGANDAPTITIGGGDSATASLTETNATPSSALTTSGTLTVTDLDINDNVTATVTAATVGGVTGGLTGPGVLSFLTPTSGDLTPGTSTTGALTWTFNSGAQTFDFLAAGETLNLTYTITVSDNHSGSATQNVTVTITGTQDAPTLNAGGDISETFTEGNLSQALSTTGSFSVTDLDLSNTLTVTEGATTVVWSGPGIVPAGVMSALTAAGAFTVSDTDPATNLATASWAFNVNANFDFLGASETLTVTIPVTVSDGTDSVSRTVTLTINGTNDAPTITTATGTSYNLNETVTTGSGATISPTLTGTLSFTDLDLNDLPTASVTSLTVANPGNFNAAQTAAITALTSRLSLTPGMNTNNGSVAWAFNPTEGELDFLQEAQVANLTYTITLDDHHGGTATQTVTINLTGTNDPVTAGTGTLTGSVLETTAAAADTLGATGSFTFSDRDLSGNVVAAPVRITTGIDASTLPALSGGTLTRIAGAATPGDPTGVRTVSWTYSNTEGNLNFLKEGETATDNFTIRIFDQATGGFLDQIVRITVTGDNDAPILSAATGGSATEDANASAQDIAAITGTLSVTDADTGLTVGDTLTASIVGSPTVSLTGNPSFVLPGTASALLSGLTFASTPTATGALQTIGWSYDPAAANLDFLGAGQTLAINFTVKVSDNSAAPNADSATQVITINITGTNDGPVAVADVIAAHTNEDVTTTITAATLLANDTDPDANDTRTVTGVSGTSANGATVTLNGTNIIYNPTSAAAFQALAVGQSLVDTFSYTITDSQGATSTSTVSITVDGRNDEPLVQQLTFAGIVATGDGVVTAGGNHSLATAISLDGHFNFAANPDIQNSTAIAHVSASGVGSGPSDWYAITVTTAGTYTFDIDHAGWDSYLTLRDSTGAILAENDDNPSGPVSGFGIDPGSDMGVSPQYDSFLNYTFRTAGTYYIEVGTSPFLTNVQNNGNKTVIANGNAYVLQVSGPERNFTGTLTEQGTPSGNITTTGTISFTDVDLADTHALNGNYIGSHLGTATVALTQNMPGTGTGGLVTWTYSVAASAVEFLAQGQTRIESFSLNLDDRHQGVVQRLVDVTIVGTNDGPVAVADVNAGNEDTTITGSVATNDSDVDTGAVLTYAQTSAIAGLTINSNGSYSFNAGNAAYQHIAQGATQTVTANYRVTDEFGATANSTLTVTLTGVNDAPTAAADVNSGNEDTIITGTVATNDNDIDDGAVLTYAQVGSVTGLTFNNNGSYSFDAGNAAYQHVAQGDSHTVTANYTVTDEFGATATSSLTITINGVNDAPTATADVNAGNEDAIITGTVATGDADIDDAAVLTYTQTSAIAGLTINSNGSYSFNAGNAAYQHIAQGATQTVTADYTVTDQFNASAASTLTITLTGVNDAPTAAADTASGNEDTTITGTVATNDNDVDDGAVLTYAQVGSVTGLTINSNGSYSFDAGNAAYQHIAQGATQTVTANYTVTDNLGATATSSLTITINGVNDAPLAVFDTASGNEDTTITGSVATNDSDIDDAHVLTYAQVGALAGLTLNSDGTYSFNAGNAAYQHLAQGASQTVTANYRVTDEFGATANSTLSITINGVNDAPVALADVASATEDAASITGSVASNDTDIDDGATRTFALNGSTAGLSMTSAGVYTFDPSNAAYQYLGQGATQTIVANYTVTDEYGATGTSTLTITVTGVNDAPTLSVGSTATHLESIDDNSIPANLVRTLIASGATVTDPDTANYNGGTLAVTVTGGDATDLLNFGSGVTISGTDVTVGSTLIGTIAGGVNSNAFTITFNAAATTANIQTLVQALNYATTDDTPDASRTVTLNLTDGALASAGTQSILVNITARNDSPLAFADARSVTENAFFQFNVSTNDSDPENNARSVIQISDIANTLPNGGTGISGGSASVSGAVPGTITTDFGAVVTMQSNGLISYDMLNSSSLLAYNQLHQGATITDTFRYQIEDSFGASHGTLSWATVTITITGINDPVTAVADTITAVENGSGLTGNILTNDTDVDIGDTHHVSNVVANVNIVSITTPSAGNYLLTLLSGVTIALGGNGAYVVTAPDSLSAGQSVIGSFTYTVQDEGGFTSNALVNVNVTGVNDAPVAAADVNAGSEDTTITGSVATNDSDADTGAILTYAQIGSVAGLTVSSNGSYSFDAGNAAYQHIAQGASQTVTANYRVTDEFGATGTSTLTITINGANDAPIAVADVNSATEDTTVTGTVATNDTDIDDGATRTYALNAAVAGLTLNNDGSYSFNAGNAAYQHIAQGATQTVIANYTTTDQFGATGTSSLTITVTGVNDAPIAVADVNSATEDTTVTGTVATNDTDIDDGATRTYALNAAVAGLTFNNDGSYSFNAGNAAYQHIAQGATQTVVANYTATDQFGATANSSLTITINGANDAPVAVADVASGNEDTIINGTVATNDTDIDDAATRTFAQIGSVAGLTINANGSYSFDAGNAAYQSLAQGVTQTIVANYRVTDQFGATGNSTLTVTVTGVNDAAILSSATVALNEANAPLSTSGALTITDIDSPATFVAQTNVAGANGLFSITSAGAWTYTANSAFDNLNVGTSVSDTFTVASADGTTTSVKVTINGTNDAAVLSSPVSVSATETDLPISVGGTLSITDIDNPATFVTQTNVAGFNGAFSITAAGVWSYVANSALDVLNAGQSVSETFSVSAVDGTTTTVTVTINGTLDIINGTPFDDTLDGRAGMDVITGLAGNDTINALADNDVLDGGAGTDTLNGGDGNDTLIGGTALPGQFNLLNGGNGNDTASYAGNAAYIYADLNTGGGHVGGLFTDLMSSIENVIAGNGGSTLNGDANANRFNGGAGDDLIFGNDGNDTLTGGGHLPGSFNQLFGGTGNDAVDYSAESRKVFVDLRAQGGHVDVGPGPSANFVLNDVMASIENATGGSNDDTLIGTDAVANILAGGAGTDTLFGLDGNDTLIGGSANAGQYNLLYGGAGLDTASYAGTTTGVYADLSQFAGYVKDGGGAFVLTDVYNEVENLTGGSAADQLIGDTGANVITGGGGADILYGNLGPADASADTFVYASAADSNLTTGYDTIVNFVTGQDKLDFTAFHINASQVSIQSGGGTTSVYANVDGIAGFDLALVVQGNNAVQTTDILF